MSGEVVSASQDWPGHRDSGTCQAWQKDRDAGPVGEGTQGYHVTWSGAGAGAGLARVTPRLHGCLTF